MLEFVERAEEMARHSATTQAEHGQLMALSFSHKARVDSCLDVPLRQGLSLDRASRPHTGVFLTAESVKGRPQYFGDLVIILYRPRQCHDSRSW
jgi:hypothetical protein